MKKLLIIFSCIALSCSDLFSQGQVRSADEIIITSIRSSQLTTALNEAFDNLRADPELVKINTGIPSFTKSDFDFINVTTSQVKGQPGLAITAKYIGSQFAPIDISFSFVIYESGTNYTKPMLIKAYSNRSSLTYFDLTENTKIMFIKNPDNTVSSDRSPVSFRNAAYRGTGCGQAVMNCIDDAYFNHGWASFFVNVLTIILPGPTFAGIAAGCIAKNCIPK